MTTYDLDPDALCGVATSTASALDPLEGHRASCSTAIDEAAGSVQSAEVTSALLNVWNLLLAPQFEGVEQRLAKMTAGLTTAAVHYDNGDTAMLDEAVRSTDAAVDIEVSDAKQVTGE